MHEKYFREKESSWSIHLYVRRRQKIVRRFHGEKFGTTHDGSPPPTTMHH